MRITTEINGRPHEVILNHNPVRTKTLSTILKSIASHHEFSLEELLMMLRL